MQKSKLIVLLISCILLQNSTFGFQEYISGDIGKGRLQGALTSLGINLGILLYGKKILGKLPDATAESKEFVKEIADQHGLPNDFEVKVGNGYAAGIGTIMLENEIFSSFSLINALFKSLNNESEIKQQSNSVAYSTLDTALQNYKDAQTDEEINAALEKIDEHIGILDHEFTHYKNNDVRNGILSTTAINLSLYAAYMAIECKYISGYLKNCSTFKKYSYLIASDIGLALTSLSLNFWNRRKQEARADEGVRNDIYILKAMARWAERLQTSIKDELNKSTGLSRKLAAMMDSYPSLYLLMDPVHPPLPEREARFKERLAELEKSSVTP